MVWQGGPLNINTEQHSRDNKEKELMDLRQKEISGIFSKVDSTPPEIRAMIREEVIKNMGEEFFNAFSTAHHASIGMAEDYDGIAEVDKISDHFPELSEDRFLVDDEVEKMGKGFCYLTCIPVNLRIKAFHDLLAFPTLFELLNKCEHILREFKLSVKEFTLGNSSTILVGHVKRYDSEFTHGMNVMSLKEVRGTSTTSNVMFQRSCKQCRTVDYIDHWTPSRTSGCSERCVNLDICCSPIDDGFYHTRVGGLIDSLRGRSKNSGKTSQKAAAGSQNRDVENSRQVLNFKKSVKGDGVEPDMSRDLYSVPKPDEIENMSDHLSSHKSGDVFPYLAVVGTSEETKDSRLSRLRAYKSAYGKENKPEMRINGVVLDELEGTIVVQDLKEHVDKERLTKSELRQNKRFKPISEASFKKPYVLISRITGEFVPLMSSSSDYTDLYFTLEDGRLLDHCTIVQSIKLPSNQNGVFELSCDYCLNIKDLSQLSLKYFLSRPVMKEGFQWGSVSLTIRMSESDTPYLIPKIEAMAIVRAPFTTLEENSKDPDHADVVFTSGQLKRLREMYLEGDVVDVDAPKHERTKKSSYSKSTLRGVTKGELGPSHLAEQDGWEHLSGMVKPRLPEGIASVSALSDDDEEDDIDVPQLTREQYVKQQEMLRKQFERPGSNSTEEIMEDDLTRISSTNEEQLTTIDSAVDVKPVKKLRFSDQDESLKSPDTKDVYVF
jgi:hypothetical protein